MRSKFLNNIKFLETYFPLRKISNADSRRVYVKTYVK